MAASMVASRSIALPWRAVTARLGFAAVIGVAIGALLFALFCLANRAALDHDLPAARAQVARAFADGTLGDQDYLAGNTDQGRHQYNDCLILRQALDQRAGVARLTVSPIVQPPVEPRTLCNTVRGYVAGEPPVGMTFYHRYIHGHTLMARVLLPHLSVAAIRTVYHTVLTLIVLAGIAVSMLALARGERRVEGIFWLIVFLAFSRWFGLETYGQSLGHGPADIVLLGFLLLLAHRGTTTGIGQRGAVVAAGLLGGLTAIFEFLTGGIPLGLAAVLGGLPFAVRVGPDERPAAIAVDAAVAFCAAVGACLLLKIALVIQVFGLDALTDSALQLRMRLGLDPTRGETVDLGAVDMLKKLVKGTDALAPGMRLMAGSVIAIAVAGGAWGARHLLRAPGDPLMRARVIMLLWSNVAILALLAAFWQHTVVHAWFMERTLVWTIASGFVLFALGCARRYGTGWDR